MDTSGTIFNADAITGGNGGNGGNGTIGSGGGGSGNGLTLGSSVTLLNNGIIAGGNGGAGGSGAAHLTSGGGGGGGHGVSGASLTVENLGTIRAGKGGSSGGPGGQSGSDGAAVQFTSGTNALLLKTDSIVEGVLWLVSGSATISAQETSQTLSDGVLVDNQSSLTLDAQQNFNVGPITGSGNITTQGQGQLSLDTVTANSLTANTSTTLNGNVTTVAGQSYNESVSLGSDVTAASTGGGSISFEGVSGDSYALDISTTGTVSIGNAVVNSLAVNAGAFSTGGLTINQGLQITTTTGNITQTSGAITVNGATTLDAIGNSINLTSATNSFAGTVHLAADNIVLNTSSALTLGNLDVSSDQGSATITSGGALTLSNAAGGQADFTLRSISGGITINSGILDAKNVTLTAAGPVNLNGMLIADDTLTLNSQTTTIVTGSINATNIDLSQGTLQIGSSGTSGSLNGGSLNLGSNTGLIFLRSDSLVTAIDITGTGSLTQAGQGTTTLTGQNDYSGGTLITGGTLALGATGTLGTGGLSLADGTTFDISSSDADVAVGELSGGSGTIVLGSNNLSFGSGTDATFAGTIAGEGGISKTGSGVTTFSGVHTYTGGTSIDEGVLALSGQGSIGSGLLSLNSPGTAFDISQTASGAAIGALAGVAGSSILLGGQTLTVGDDTSSTFDGAIDGTGGLIKTGTGTLTIGGSNNYSGGTQLNAGTLALAGLGTIGSGGLTISSGSTFDISAAGSNVSLSSLAGSGGAVNLGAQSLSVGSSDESTSYAGVINGTGALIKTGSGTLTLSGINNYSGGTLLNAGTLALSGLGSIGSGALNLTAAGTTFDISGTSAGATIGSLSGVAGSNIELGDQQLTFGDDASTTFAGVISGTGTLAKAGTGTVTLTGINDYSGGTLLNAGTLALSGASTIGSGGLTLSSGSTFDISAASSNISISSLAGAGGTVNLGAQNLSIGSDNTSTTFAGVINGNGGLIKTGTGTTTLTGVSNYAGDTLLNSGTLALSGLGTIGTGGLTLSSGSTFDIASTTSGASIGALSGTGGSVQLGNQNLTVGSDDSNSNFAGVISGTGSLIKTGTGITTLSDANDYSGSTVINGGTIALTGIGAIGTGALVLATSDATFDLSGSTVDASLGSLSGDGDILLGSNTLSVGSDNSSTTYSGNLSGSGNLVKLGTGKLVLEGNVAPQGGSQVAAGSLIVGGSAGSSATLSSDVTVEDGALLGGHGFIIGNVLLNSGGILSTGNSIGTLNVDGDVTYSAGSIMELETNPDGTSDRLIATGTVNLGGSTLNVLAGAGDWAANTTYNIVQAGTLEGTFGTVTTDLTFLTANLSYSDTTADLQLRRNDILFASVAQTANQRAVATALDSAVGVGGTVYDAISVLNEDQARVAYDSLSGEIHASTRTALFDESRLVREAVTGQLRNAQARLPDGSTLHYDAATGLTVWLKGYGSWSESDGDSNAADLDRETYGTLIGADIALNDAWRVGAFTGYGRSEFDSSARNSSAVSQNTHLGAYLGGQWDQLNLRLGVAHTWHEIDSKRKTQIGTQSDTLKGSYDASTTQVFGEVGYAIQLDALELEPFVGVTHVKVDSDGFRERGGDAALQGKSEKDSATYSNVGLRAAAPIGRIAEKPVELQTSLAWQHVIDAPSRSSNLQLAGYDAFAVEGTSTARNNAVVQAGIGIPLSSQARVDLGYSGLFGDGNTDHGVRIGLSVSF